jgi:hypothetical protein
MPEYNVSCKFTGNDGENVIQIDFTGMAYTTEDHEELIGFLHHFVRVFKQV